jgi:hypothetical protein
MGKIFEIYNRWEVPVYSRPLDLSQVVSRIDATFVVKSLVERLYHRGHLGDDDLAVLLGEGIEVKSWCVRDFYKEFPDEAGEMSVEELESF